MVSTAATNRTLEGKVAVVTASTEGWVAIMRVKIEAEAGNVCCLIGDVRLSVAEAYVQGRYLFTNVAFVI